MAPSADLSDDVSAVSGCQACACGSAWSESIRAPVPITPLMNHNITYTGCSREPSASSGIQIQFRPHTTPDVGLHKYDYVRLANAE